MTLHRVVVTGLGAITPLGIGARRFWDATLAGEIATRRVTRFDPSELDSQVAAQVDDFVPADYMDARRVRRTDRFAQFAIAATQLAFDDAGLRVNGDGDDFGIYIGSALGGIAFGEEQHDRYQTQGIGVVRPLLATSLFGGASTCNIAMHFGLHGPTIANGNSCAAGTVAIGEAFRAIARGDTRRAVAGGVEAPLSPFIFGTFSVIRAMSRRNDDPAGASRPFDLDRDGFVMAEGAGVLVLERYDDAVARDAPIYGEIAGYGLTADGHHMTAPGPDGRCSARAMSEALREARLTPAELELIDAHGSATTLNDKTETLAIRTALGPHAGAVPVVATKGQHGHALGATGAWEAILSLLMLRERRIPGTVNLKRADPECDLAHVRTTREADVRTILSSSAGFGGINAALVFRHAS